MAKIPPIPAPAFGHITPEFILTVTNSVLASSRRLCNDLVTSLSPDTATFASVILPLTDDENNSGCRCRSLVLLAQVSPDGEIREAARRAEKLISQADTEALARQDLAALIQAVIDKGEDLEPEDAHLLFKKSQECALVKPERYARYMEASKELGELRSICKKALSDGNDDGIAISKSDLDGLPASVLSTMKAVTVAENDDGDEQVWVTFRKSHYAGVLRNVSTAETRKRLYVAKQKRFPENADRLNRIVALRDEIARLRDFDNHAALKIREKMAKSVEDVRDTLEGMHVKLRPLARMEEQRLVHLRKNLEEEDSRGHDNDTDNVIYPWDWSYYEQKLTEGEYSVKTTELTEYFEIWRTLQGLMGVMSQIFGLRFEVIENVETWHPEVVAYAVWDTTDHSPDDDFLGYLYVDLFGREGKYAGAFMYPITPGFIDMTGTRHYPSAALICSVTRAEDNETDTPCHTLLRHNEMRTMFHELGHCIHHLVAKTKYDHRFPRDFVEIPSLLLEHWAWVPQVLKKLGRHYLDGTEIPDKMIDDLVKIQYLNDAHAMLAQVHLAMFDLTIHSPESHEVAKSMDLTRLWRTMKKDIVGLSLGDKEDEGHGQASFPHIFRAYDAGYFAYPTSKVYASDIYSTFFADDPMSHEAGRRYQSMVLELGASIPEWDILKAYMGRDLNGNAFYSELSASD